MAKTILVIDDDRSICETLRLYFSDQGYSVAVAMSGREGLEKLGRDSFEAIVLDLYLPDINGLDVLAEIKRRDVDIPVIVITAFHDMSTTVKAMKLGAFEYIHKPIDIDELEDAIERAMRACATVRRREHYLFTEVSQKYRIGDIVGKSKKMVEIFKTIGIVSQSRTTVLIEGESGTGKELIARAIHDFTDRDKPFIAVNCSAIVETLLESELFGHEKGAFTGAIYQKPGKFELADKGTIFLDEIGDMSLNMQVKLLRVMEQKEFERVGGKEKIKTDVRIIAATNQNLEELVKQGKFRDDLYYRLKVITIKVPPLRERREDIPLLVDHLVNKINQELGKHVRRIPKSVMEKLVKYDWPGNVRELENVLRRAVLLSRGEVLLEEYLPELGEEATLKEGMDSKPEAIKQLDDVEREHILNALRITKGNKSETCRLLGISYPTLQRKLRKYKVDL